MRSLVFGMVCTLGLVGVTTSDGELRAAEINVLCSSGLKAVAEELLPRFERATGHRVVAKFALAAQLKQRIESGETFDVTILTPAMIDSLIEQNRVAADTRAVVARSGLGLLIKEGARKPDVATVDALKKTLLEARSITYAKEGVSGVLFAGVLETLGIAEALRARTLYTASGEEVGDNVVSGKAELGVLPLSEILPVRGAVLGALLPAEVQQYIVMAGGVSRGTAEGVVARELLDFLLSAQALDVIEAKGMVR